MLLVTCWPSMLIWNPTCARGIGDSPPALDRFPGASNVSFPITTKSADAQKFFNQGVTQIHGFWYFEAERSFRQAAALDSDCAMAYWGMAMANINTPKRAADFMKEAAKRKDKAGRREQL